MSSKNDYEKKLDLIGAIDEKQIKHHRNIPVGVYLQEAANLYNWCQEDRKKLTTHGLSWQLVKELPLRAGALREAEALWNEQRNTKKEATGQWKKIAPGTRKFKNQLLEYFRFAFRNDNQLLEKVKGVTEGKTNADLVQGLNDLCVLGKAHTALLEEINFDMTLLDGAAERGKSVSTLLARVNAEKIEHNEARIIRDKAYFFLKQVMDEIYSFGKFVFRDNEERRRGYRSDYMHNRLGRHRHKVAGNDN